MAGIDILGLQLNIVVFLITLGLAAILVLLFAVGWSWKAALETVSYSLVIILFAVSLSGAWSLSHAEEASGAQVLWRAQGSTIGLYKLKDSLKIASQAHTGQDYEIGLHLSGEISPALAWALRDYHNVSPTVNLEGEAVPVALAPEHDISPAFEADYFGQSISVSQHWGWDGVLPEDVLSWWIRHDAPVVQERWILFIRADVFGNSEINP
jgi:hypothetical protein